MAEGTKCVLDTIEHFKVRRVYATAEWADKYGKNHIGDITIANKQQLSRMSALKTVSDVVAVYEMPESNIPSHLETTLSIVLDGVQDPGNLGTILRVADWFGIKTVFCSKDTVDVFNPKSIQATMGAISRVSVIYCDLEDLFYKHKDMPIYGTLLDGENIYTHQLGQTGFIIMGNEGKGISEPVRKHVTDRLLIPSFPPNCETSESLNVGMATAIVVAEFRRRAL